MTTTEADKLLAECREFLVDRLRTSVTRMMVHVEDVLFERAAVDGSTRAAEVSRYIDAVREIRMKKREVQVRFENRFVSLFDRSLREIRAGRPRAGDPRGGGASRPEEGQADAGTVENAMEAARTECRASLSMLDRHVGALLDQPDLDEFINPLQPDTVFDAFLDSCSDINAGADIRNIIVDMFRRHVVADLHDVYADLNVLFESHELAAGDYEAVPEDHARREPDENGYTWSNSVLVSGWMAGNIREAIGEADIPGFVRVFLLRDWRLVLEKQYRRHGEKSREWARSMQVVADLVACTRSTADRDQRRQQIWMLPGLVYRLKNGMKSVAMPLKQQVDFLSRLKTCHADTDTGTSGTVE